MNFTLSDWRALAITQEILAEIKRRQEWAKEQLASGVAANNAFEYGRLCGAIAAYQDFLDIELDEETHGN